MGAKKIKLDDIKLKPQQSNSSLVELLDDELSNDFLVFHSENASIRLISKFHHLKTSHQFRMKKSDKQLELQF